MQLFALRAHHGIQEITIRTDAAARPANPPGMPASTAINAPFDRRSPAMTHSDHRPPMPSPPVSPVTAAMPDDNPPHADYNLLPLEVQSLGHYVKYEDVDEGERFHVH